VDIGSPNGVRMGWASLLIVACDSPGAPPVADAARCTPDTQGDSELLLRIDPALGAPAVVEVAGVSCVVGGAAVASIAVPSSEDHLVRLVFRDAAHTTVVWAPFAAGGRLVFHWTTGASPVRFEGRLSGPEFEACADPLDGCPVGRLRGSGGRATPLVPGADGLVHVWDGSEELLVVARAGRDYLPWRGPNGQDPPVRYVFVEAVAR
jgi:hypothetical protein